VQPAKLLRGDLLGSLYFLRSNIGFNLATSPPRARISCVPAFESTNLFLMLEPAALLIASVFLLPFVRFSKNTATALTRAEPSRGGCSCFLP